MIVNAEASKFVRTSPRKEQRNHLHAAHGRLAATKNAFIRNCFRQAGQILHFCSIQLSNHAHITHIHMRSHGNIEECV